MSNSKNESSISYEVKFVVPKGKTTAEVSEIMKTGFEAMECNCLEPMWINHDECLQFKEKQSKLFVTDCFGDEAFQHLSTLKCRILGPLCILSCLHNGQSLPLRQYPVYSVTMRAITVTCSNIDKATRNEIAEKTRLMGGLFNKDLTQSVTHLIVDSVGSAKYHVANRIGLPVMLPEWINDCWNNGQYQQLHANDSLYNRYRCPIFKGLCITVSQLSNEERKNVQQAIEQNGGRYSGQMRANVTTHLVLVQPKGDKYKFGKTWKIKCVKLSWLYESLEAGYCKEEMQYQLDKTCDSGHDTSTPEKNSIVHKSKQLGECSTISDISIIPYRESRIDETTNSDVTIIPVTSAADFYSFRPLDELSDISNGGQFLDGCRIFISGFSGIRLDKMRKIINAGCGTRFNKMGENITHIILGEKNEDIFKCASECSTKPHVVSYLWLLNCYKEGKLLDEEPYKMSNTYINRTHTISQNKKLSTLQTSEENTDVTNNFNNAINHNISIEENMNTDEIPPLDIVVAPQTTSKPQNTLEEGCLSSEGNLFLGFTIIINGFGPKDTDLIQQMIKSENGKVVTGSVADFCIVPITGSNDMAVPETNVVTNCWLQMCIEQEVLLPFDSNPLFKPLSIKLGSVILKGCVLSFSQYMGTERDCLTHLAEEMGAHCQEYFVRKASKSRKLLPNTHLVVATPEGTKYEAAKKWNIPAITKDWLFASVYKGEKASEEEYLVDFQLPMTKDSASASIQVANGTNLPENNASNKEASNIKIATPTNNEGNLSINGNPNKCRKDIKSQAGATRCGSEPTPSKFLNPDISFHPDYEVNSLLSMLDNSNTAGGHNRKASLPMQDLFALNISKALKNIGVEQNISGVSAYQEHACSDLPKNNLKENTKPLKNIVVCVSKKLVGKHSELNNIIISLGGECQWSYSNSCTHFVCQGKSGAISREIKLAQDEGKKIVSPEWIYACKDAFAYVDEMLYPFTHNPRLSLLGQISSKKVNSTISPCKITDDECFIVDQLQSKASNFGNKCQLQIIENKKEKKGEKVKEGTITKELEDLLNVTKTKADKSIATSPNSKASGHNFENEFGAPPDTEKNVKPEEPSGKIQTALPETETQSVPIAWDDPTGRCEREQLAEHVSNTTINIELNAFQKVDSPEKQVKCAEDPLEKKTQIIPTSDFHNGLKVTNTEGDMHELETEKNNTAEITHNFMFSGLSDNEKDHYYTIIECLGGKVSTIKSFDSKATHLILGQPLKNEKLLSSVASGLWVLHKTYIEACEKAGRFIDESCHEWGGPMTYRLENALPDHLSKVAMCPSRWRVKIQDRRKNSGNMKCGAFQGWKVLIIAEKQKQLTYSRILQAGGAEVVPLPLTPRSNGITHAFIEVKSQRELNKINLESLVSSGISCLKSEYLAFYLIEPVIPPEEKFIIREVQELIGKISTEKKRKCAEESIGVAKRHHQHK